MLSKNEKNIMALVLNDHEFVRDKLLTERQFKILKFVKKRQSVTSIDLMSFLDCGIQGASSALKKLHTKKYLNRLDVGDPTGGSLHLYTLNNELRSH